VSIQNLIEYFFFILLVRFFQFFGLNKARLFAKPLAVLFFYIIPIRKSTVFENLGTAFPDISENDIKKIAFKCYYSFTIALIEIICLPLIKREKLKYLMDCPQIQLLQDAYSKDKGMIILTAHFGNWEIGAASIAAHLGLPLHVVAKDQRNPYITNWLNKMRKKCGNTVTPLGVSIKNVYMELKNKNVLGIVGDQRGPKEGMRVNFFNKSTAVYPGTAILAVKTGSPVAIGIIVRQPDFKYRVFFEIIYPDNLSGSEEEKARTINQKYFSILESYIKKYPDQWFWMHKIWKY
jgi:KDO2-lipid IV(A) lauroyltransferase